MFTLEQFKDERFSSVEKAKLLAILGSDVVKQYDDGTLGFGRTVSTDIVRKYFDLSNLKGCVNLFAYGLQRKIDLTGVVLPRSADCTAMFFSNKVEYIDFGDSSILITDANWLFYNCFNVKIIKMTNVDIKSSMRNLFLDCTKLEELYINRRLYSTLSGLGTDKYYGLDFTKTKVFYD